MITYVPSLHEESVDDDVSDDDRRAEQAAQDRINDRLRSYPAGVAAQIVDDPVWRDLQRVNIWAGRVARRSAPIRK